MVLIRDSDKKKKDLSQFEVSRKLTENVQPNDELYISVGSSDERPTNFTIRASEFSTLDVTLRSYTVDSDGYIRFPYLNKVYVQGKSLEEVSDEIELTLRDYILTPSVVVKFVNKKITVLGEVYNPGVYNFYDKSINVLQAIAHAGDITTFGNRKEAVLIREEDAQITKYKIDLTDEKLLLSDQYIVKPDDIIYIEPLRIKRWGFESFPYTLAFTILNTALIIWTFTLTLY